MALIIWLSMIGVVLIKVALQLKDVCAYWLLDSCGKCLLAKGLCCMARCESIADFDSEVMPGESALPLRIGFHVQGNTPCIDWLARKMLARDILSGMFPDWENGNLPRAWNLPFKGSRNDHASPLLRHVVGVLPDQRLNARVNSLALA